MSGYKSLNNKKQSFKYFVYIILISTIKMLLVKYYYRGRLKMKKVGKIFAISICVLFIVIGTIVSIKIIKTRTNSKHTQGIITYISREYIRTNSDGEVYSYKTTIEYEINGIKYTDTISGKAGNIGNKIKVYYDPYNPSHIVSSTPDYALLMIPLLGIIGLVIILKNF